MRRKIFLSAGNGSAVTVPNRDRLVRTVGVVVYSPRPLSADADL